MNASSEFKLRKVPRFLAATANVLFAAGQIPSRARPIT